MSYIICRAIAGGHHSARFVTEKIEDGKVVGKITNNATSLSSIIESDKKYGFLKPKNGKYYTYKILSVDTELTDKRVHKAVMNALHRWGFKLKIEYKRAKPDEAVDITIRFSSEQEDSLLNSSTLAYMYYPLGGSFNGTMVINTRFYWTLSGKAVNLHFIDPIHYPDVMTAPIQGQSWDLDQVMGHEFGHGIFGLQHFETGLMAYRYDLMTEYTEDPDIIRASQKVPKRNILDSLVKRKMDWLRVASDREYE